MQVHGARAWIDHIAGVWANAPHDHDHKQGWENCRICGKHANPDAARHNHDNGITHCRACKLTTCGDPTCTICAA